MLPSLVTSAFIKMLHYSIVMISMVLIKVFGDQKIPGVLVYIFLKGGEI